MNIPFLTPSRCVLLIGDDALYVYNVTFNAARLVDTVPWQADKFEDTVISLIRKECGGKAVLILNDMTDQHFKGGQRLPKVGILDKNNVLDRKLQVAFPSYPIRGALAVKPPKGTEMPAAERKLQAGLYLFAAVPMSEPVARTMDTVRKSLSSVAGFYLLPVEASDMVRTLAANLAGKTREPARWVVFIGQHHNGALRQVIIRDGQLAMTRMTPVTDTADHDVWAQDVHQEFRATISYLSRFGFSASDGVDVIVVCHPTAGAALENLIDIPCHYSAFTAPEAARELGISIGSQDDPHYADPLHAAWIGRKQRFVLPMQATELAKVDQPRKIAAAAIFLLLLGTGYLAWQVFAQIGTMNTTNEGLDNEQRQMRVATADYESEVAKMNALGFDVKLVQGAIKTFKSLDAQRMDELALLQKIDKALGDQLRLDSLTVDDGSGPATGVGAIVAAVTTPAADPNAPPPKPKMNVALKLSFPPTIEPEFGVQQVNDFKHRLETALPNCKVEVVKNVAGLEYSDTYQGEATQTPEKAGQQQEFVAELRIGGDIVMIQILGIKRILVLASLLGLNLILAAAVFLYLTPHNDDLAKQLQTLTGQVVAKRGEAMTLKTQYQTIEDQKVYFGNLQAAGFFGDQNRTLVRQRIGDIQKFTNILAARYDVTAAQVEHDPGADEAGYVVLDSPIKVDVDALDDTDFYNFTYWLENAFPGHVSVTKIDLIRPLDVSQTTLKEIGSGIPATLIKGTINFSWRTIVPATQVSGGAPAAPKG